MDLSHNINVTLQPRPPSRSQLPLKIRPDIGRNVMQSYPSHKFLQFSVQKLRYEPKYLRNSFDWIQIFSDVAGENLFRGMRIVLTTWSKSYQRCLR